MRIEDDTKLDFDDVLIRPKRSELSSRKDVDLIRTYSFKHSHYNYSGTPIIAANMDSVGTFKMSLAFDEYGMSVALHKHYSLEEITDHLQILKENYDIYNSDTWYSMGITEQDFEKFKKFMRIIHPDYHIKVCIDVANGYQKSFVEFVSKMRNEYPKITIMAGNVVTADMTSELILAGADIVKVGIGPGSVCTTRTKTGIGYPQLSAIIECADAAHGLKGHICADGGCKTPGDVAKAFGAGADFVMLGGMLAGHDECEGEITNTTPIWKTSVEIEYNEENSGTHGRLESYWSITDTATGKTITENASPYEFINHTIYRDFVEYIPTVNSTMIFYGMSSKEAQEKHSDGLKDYRASEGKCVEVPYRGKVESTIQEILGGLRSACTYVGAENLKELSKCTTFIRVNRQKNDIYGSD